MKQSRPFEDWNEKLFQEQGYKTKRNNGPGWDIEAIRWEHGKLRDIFVECKDQPMSEETGNYFLERKSILDTLAHFTATQLPHYFSTGRIRNAFLVPLRDFIDLFNAYPKTHGGNTFQNSDGTTKYNNGALVPRAVFESANFQRL